MKKRFCFFCNDELHGRSDKKFCDAQCRSNHHNNNKAAHEKLIQYTNSLLRKNRGILAHFCPQGKATVRKEVLDAMEYEFSIFTTIYPFKGGNYFFCYDYGFLPITDENGIKKIVIVQHQNYMSRLKVNPWKVK
ncbi:hypothetical protein [Joostella sp.]|uniref:hypothetical protein n=1 Tax=Joostella sp. TaxID=2231138 RepID=UPI003A8ED795